VQSLGRKKEDHDIHHDGVAIFIEREREREREKGSFGFSFCSDSPDFLSI